MLYVPGSTPGNVSRSMQAMPFIITGAPTPLSVYAMVATPAVAQSASAITIVSSVSQPTVTSRVVSLTKSTGASITTSVATTSGSIVGPGGKGSLSTISAPATSNALYVAM